MWAWQRSPTQGEGPGQQHLLEVAVIQPHDRLLMMLQPWEAMAHVVQPHPLMMLLWLWVAMAHTPPVG
jgi:hypothetical protein